MPPDYTSVWNKLGRAEELLNGLDAEVRAWQDTKPYFFTKDFNAEFTRYSVVAHVNTYPPITRWSLIIADIIHNIRCSLDHLIWAIAVYESPNGIPKEDKISFPIWDAPPNSNARRNIETLSESVRAMIEIVQPYMRPHDSFPRPILTILRDIDNGNKHKLLMLAISSVYRGKIHLQWEHTPEQPFVRVNTGDIKDGTEIIVATCETPHPDMKVEIMQLGLIIALRHPAPHPVTGADRDDYGALLDSIIGEVKIAIEIVSSAIC